MLRKISIRQPSQPNQLFIVGPQVSKIAVRQQWARFTVRWCRLLIGRVVFAAAHGEVAALSRGIAKDSTAVYPLLHDLLRKHSE